MRDVLHPILIVYSEVDIATNERAQLCIYSQSEIGKQVGSYRKLGSSLSLPNVSTESRVHQTPRMSLKEIRSGHVTLDAVERYNKLHDSNASNINCPPFSMAMGFIKPKDKLVVPKYLSTEYIHTHINDSEYYCMMERFEGKIELTQSKEYLIIDKYQLEARKSVVGDIIKKYMKAALHGQSLSGVPLPIKINEPMSMLCSFSRGMANLDFLHRACNQTDPLEILKFVILFQVSGLQNSVIHMKPLNPYLGETAQGYFADGSNFYAEKIIHTPLHIVLSIINDRVGFKVDFRYTESFELGVNEFRNTPKGVTKITIRDQDIYLTVPSFWNRGLMYGKSVMGFEKYFFFHYPAAKLKAWVKIRNKHRADAIEGAILPSGESLVYSSDKFGSNIFPGLNPLKTHNQNVVGRISGGFTEHISIDGVEMWNGSHKSYKLKVCDDVLPSDWRFREDLIWFHQGQVDLADEWKGKLENVQRDWRKLREDGQKARAKAKKTK